MKTAPIKSILAMLLLAPCMVFAQFPTSSPVSLDAQPGDNGKSIHCTVSTLSNTGVKAKLVFVFFTGTDGGKIVSNGSGEVSVDKMGSCGIDFNSGDTTDDGKTYESQGLQFGGNGSKPKSWIVQAYVDGKLVAWKTSGFSDKLEAIAKTTVKLPPL